MSDWMIVPRGRDGQRLTPLSGWETLTHTERCDPASSWTLTGKADVVDRFDPGMGALIYRDGVQIDSGPLWSYQNTGALDQSTGRTSETVTLGFISDDDVLGYRHIWQSPGAVLDRQLRTMPAEHDTRTGPREDILLGYIASNLGNLARPERRLPTLDLPASRGRGGSTTHSARMRPLAETVYDLAEAAGLRVRVRHDESSGAPRLGLSVTERVDRSGNVRFGLPGTAASALITGWDYGYEAPTGTRAIVAAAGEKTARKYVQALRPAVEELWNIPGREIVIDQRQTEDLVEVLASADEGLDDAVAPASVSLTVADSPDIRHRRDYHVGDRVAVLLPGREARLDTVREAVTTVSAAGGGHREHVQIIVGAREASVIDTPEAVDIIALYRRLRALEASY